MICPLCKAEYQDGFYTCADCSAPLVIKQSQQDVKTTSEIYTGDFAEVFQTSDQSIFLTVKLAFDGEGIPHNFAEDVLFGYRGGLLARFFVPTAFVGKATAILNSLGHT